MKRAPLVVLIVIFLATSSCSTTSAPPSGSPDVAEPTTSTVATASSSTTVANFSLEDVPPEARVSSGGGDPRGPEYWVIWNTCAPDNRAAAAEANGGRAAGWLLVDDLLADPGIGLGDHLLTTCNESLALLGGRTGAGEETADPVYQLAAQLVAAELNLNVGAETCPVAEEVVMGAHLVMAATEFDGVSTSPLDSEAAGALPQLIELLRAYNTGELCR